jgi:hypothetical protein
MLSKLHNNDFRLLIVVRMYLIVSMVVGVYLAIAQSEPTATTTKDYNWLVRLCTEQGLRESIYDDDVDAATKKAAIAELTKSLNQTEKDRIDKFVQRTKKEPYYSALIRLNGYICKRWPCPPPPIHASGQMQWLVPVLRDTSLRDQLHLKAVRGLRNTSGTVLRSTNDLEISRKDIVEFKSLAHKNFSGLTDPDLETLLEFFVFQENWILVGRLGEIACADDITGPCP